MESIELPSSSSSSPPPPTSPPLKHSLLLLPLLVPAILLTGEVERWSAPFSVVLVFGYLVSMEAYLDRERRPRLYFLLVLGVWFLWLLRREVFLHHGEPWFGWPAFLSRALCLLALQLSTFSEAPWKLRLSTLPIMLIFIVLFFCPYAGDSDVMAPIYKTTILAISPQLLLRFWKEERLEDVSAPKRLLIQLGVMISLPWWCGWTLPLVVLLRLLLLKEQKHSVV